MISLNGTPVNVTLFPDQTSQVWHLPESVIGANSCKVEWAFSHEGELVQLAQLVQLLDKLETRITLNIKYLPYGRQDKEVTNTSTFALRTFAKFINTLRLTDITIMDPHSKVALDLINNSKAVYPIPMILNARDATKANLFCYPDKGALDKYVQIYDFPYIYGSKVRDQATGRITSYELIGNPWGDKVLIVDDICDGGATFILLAKRLLDVGATEVNLFVTHGIFSKGLKPLFDAGIKRIFTQDGEVSEVQNKIVYRRL